MSELSSMLRQNSHFAALPRRNKNPMPVKSLANQSLPVPLNHPDLIHPDWKRAYCNVLQETDTPRLCKLVEIAEAAILTRLDALVRGSNHRVERQALEDALHKLKRLKATRLRFDPA